MGEAMQICHASPIGALAITFDESGAITGLIPEPGGTPEVPESSPAERAARQLDEYFAGTRCAFDLPLAPVGTAFQREVWRALTTIPYGTTTSYGAIAELIGRPRASRAVGQAIHVNPIAILRPCHRVVGADGSLTGYAWGLDRKRFLLKLEGSLVH
jgi:methylated-DNA-[protein]-cysteine S-methyltransferase